ncbi:MAG: ShlB/FhaC/HecB family hemolysin secretion/activation protein [Pseudomonadota bacterium]|nr:ShlB/FhaC/HecB family hemolysin secretion/activation protein [Pseudomonadota bacterium]
MRLLSFFALILVILAITPCALAQTLPGAVEPGRIEKRFESPPTPQAEIDIRIPEKAAEIPEAEADALRFMLEGLTVEGSTVYTEADFRPLIEELLLEEVTLKQLNALAERLTVKYRNDGYILSRVILPAQEVEGGMVHLRAVEGYIIEVRVEGETGGRDGIWDHWADKLKASRPLHISVLERYSLLANELAGLTVQAQVKPDKDAQGAAVVLFTIEKKDFDAALTFDNRGTKSTGPWQSTLAVTAFDLLGLGGSTSVQGIATSQIEELRYGTVSYSRMLNGEGLALSLSASRSVSEPGDVLKTLGVASQNKSLSATMTYPAIRSRRENLLLSAGLRYTNSKSNLACAPSSRDRLRVLTLGASYDISDEYKGVNLFDVKLHRGLDILNASDTNSNLLSRSRGVSDFTKLTATAIRRQVLTRGLGMTVSLSGQAAFNQLLAGEEFGYGGTQYGRAYDPSEITGDHGLAGSVTVNYNNMPPIVGVDFMRPFVYWDIGVIDNKGSDTNHESAASAGFGLRFGAFERITGEIEFAAPLTRPVSSLGDSDPRLFFSLTARY